MNATPNRAQFRDAVLVAEKPARQPIQQQQQKQRNPEEQRIIDWQQSYGQQPQL